MPCAHAIGKADTPVRQKRRSLHHDSATKKRRKFDQPLVPKSPSSHAVPSKSLLTYPTFTNPGLPLIFGVGDIGQLGLGPDITERSRPARFTNASLSALGLGESDLENFIVQVCAGGMHTVLLTTAGRVITFGCNDEGALGRKISSSPPDTPAEDATEADSENKSATQDLLADETLPAYVPLPLGVKIVMVSAGDSHTAALDSDGQVWVWGTFRGPNGPIGLTQAGEISWLPRRLLVEPAANATTHVSDGRASTAQSSHLMPGVRVIKITSGQDHLVCLTEEGRLYTMGSAEQGQLGRIAERFCRTGGRSGINSLLYPTECRVRGTVRFSDAWAGGFSTFARCQATGAIYACGLNNYGQLGLKGFRRLAPRGSHNGGGTLEEEDAEMGDGHEEEDDADMSVDAARLITDRNEADKSEAAMIARQGPLIQFMLTRARAFDPARGWRQFSASVHHTLALDSEGHVYSVGRLDYGRLGLAGSAAPNTVSVIQPTRVQGLLDKCTCVWIGTGEACSFAVDNTGTAYSWGMRSNQQLGHGNEDDDDGVEPAVVLGKQLTDRFVSMIDAGGQHTVLLAHSSKPALSDAPVAVVSTPELPVNESTDSGPGKQKPSDEALGAGGALEKSTEGACGPPDPSEKAVSLDSGLEPGLHPPVVSSAPFSPAGRARHISPCSTTLIATGVESATESTAGATINSSVHSSAVSDTSSVASCGSTTSTSSQLNSAKSTDGGGSSRCSSFDTYSVQSSLPVGGDAAAPSASNGSLMLDPLSASLLVGARYVPHTGRLGCSTTNRSGSSAQIRSAGMSICSTSSEPGLLTDTVSLGSMTASPMDLASGDLSNS